MTASISANDHLIKLLDKRKESNSFRELTTKPGLVDFCSNDYLGFARSKELAKKIADEFESTDQLLGSGGSRLLAGNSEYAARLESFIADFHKTEAALIFNSGYDANVGLFSSLPQKGDTVLYDELIHASIHDGMRISQATRDSFLHNDLNDLEGRLKNAKGIIYVVVESVYSMDGDHAPLKLLADLCVKYNANLIVDEAHATGIYGIRGEGKVVELNLEKHVFARIHTFGKALGVHGAAVVGSKLLCDYLINFARSFIYSTSLPMHSLVCISNAYRHLVMSGEARSKLLENIQYFKTEIDSMKAADLFRSAYINSESPVQCVVFSGNKYVKFVSEEVGNTLKFDVRPVLSPTVPKKKERLRICIHAFNTTSQVSQLLNWFDQLFLNPELTKKYQNHNIA